MCFAMSLGVKFLVPELCRCKLNHNYQVCSSVLFQDAFSLSRTLSALSVGILVVR